MSAGTAIGCRCPVAAAKYLPMVGGSDEEPIPTTNASSPTPPPPVEPLKQLESLGPGDTTGAETFTRYRYQAKVAVQRWLAGLEDAEEFVAVVCEYAEDVVVVTTSELVLSQVKTKDAGAWTVSSLIGSEGLKALVRSYNQARSAEFVDTVRLELLLEGPLTETKEDREVFEDPTKTTSKGKSLREHLVASGLDKAHIKDFLSRLTIRPHLPSRDSIDSINLHLVGNFLPTLGMPELRKLYDRLLQEAENAQEAASGTGEFQWTAAVGAPDDERHALEKHLLSRTRIRELVPVLPAALARSQDLLDKLAKGSGVSLLELKMGAAGAEKSTIDRAKELRAEASAVLASLGDGEQVLARLERLIASALAHAESFAKVVAVEGKGEPAKDHRSAELIFNGMAVKPTELRELDPTGLFAQVHLGVLGLLCQLSDECKFGWRAA